MQGREENKRIIPEVSIAKGIGILLVVIGHCVPNIFHIKQFIYLFHMPLFFFLSGYCYRVESEEKMLEYIFRKVKTLYIPFVMCNGIALLFHQLFCRIGVYPEASRFTSIGQLIRYCIQILLCIKMEDIVAPTWFLPILMFVSIGYAILRKMIARVRLSSFAVYICAVAIYLSGFCIPRGGLYRAYILVAMGMFSYNMGFVFRKYCVFERISNYITALFMVILLISAQFIDINLIQMRIGDPVSYALLSIMGICVTVKLAEALVKVQFDFFSEMGSNSLVILKWHYYIFLVITVAQKMLITGKIEGGIEGFVMYYSPVPFCKFFWFCLYVIGGIYVPLTVDKMARRIKGRG